MPFLHWTCIQITFSSNHTFPQSIDFKKWSDFPTGIVEVRTFYRTPEVMEEINILWNVGGRICKLFFLESWDNSEGFTSCKNYNVNGELAYEKWERDKTLSCFVEFLTSQNNLNWLWAPKCQYAGCRVQLLRILRCGASILSYFQRIIDNTTEMSAKTSPSF